MNVSLQDMKTLEQFCCLLYLWQQKVSGHCHLPHLVKGHISKLFKHLHIYIMSVEHTLSKRGRVLQLRNLNYSYRGIEEITGVLKSTAQETVNHDKNHHTCQSRPCSGCPASVSDCDHRHILCHIHQHRFEPYRSITERVGSVTECQVKTGHKLMMLWGAIAHGQKGPLIRLNLSAEEIDEVENLKKKKS
jgi:hypothetical protein